ncbi:Glycoside hydrolase family 3, partial [Penicillium hordei]
EVAIKRITMPLHIERLLTELSIDEKIALVSGTDFWHTASIPRLQIPSIRLSDGPNGVRGTKLFNGVPAACFPCGTAIGATWDVKLAREAGELQGKEAIVKGVAVILGPTVNMQRSPLGGRGFESFSEDPILSGKLGAEIVNGIQSTGVSAAIKHFVCNDQEDQRQLVDSIVTERALREIYLLPFQIVQRDAIPKCYMTAYNRLNGVHCSENPALIQGILREEWGFDGLVLSDWFGTYSTTEALKAGLDLEMPGPSLVRGRLITRALSCGKLLPHELDCRVREVLKLVDHGMALNVPENAPERTLDTPETANLLRKIASSSIVLMKNDNNILPFTTGKTTAVIGPNAAFAAYCGGGSAALCPYRAVSPLEGIRSQSKSVQYTLGSPGWKRLPLLSGLCQSANGSMGLDMMVYLEDPSIKNRSPVDHIHVSNSEVFLMDYKNPKIKGYLYYADFVGTLIPEASGQYEFSITVAGTAKLYVDGQCVVDNATKQTRGDSFFGTGTIEEIGSIWLEAGKSYNIHGEMGTDPTVTFQRPGASGFGAGGVRFGAARKFSLEEEIEKAVKLAKSVDQVVLCVGLNGDWESEGYDRQNMDLPPGTEELIDAVLQVNPTTAIVVQSGTPVTMPWIDKAQALLQAWYGGNETGHAIADVLFGAVNPSGKLPLTFPVRNEDNPAYFNFRSEANRVIYGEDVYVGYRWYENSKKQVLFPFGHGLSYTTFKLSSLSIDFERDEVLVSVNVENTGSYDGAYVVQVYVSPPQSQVNRPRKELKGFSKIFLRQKEQEKALIRMNRKHATSYWDETRHSWIEEGGKYTVYTGDSTSSTPLKKTFHVPSTSWWSGL